ncbi:MAG: bifunctional diaminohydroxyphosphoribosylaminopyrimidine deaminase/5-amino-6-(5-phosphoribosylamino)uracil reductase RibD [Chloroflexota bacterium]
MSDEEYMKMALRLARRGRYRTSPNPMVGAVIVRDGRVIGSGYHRYFGGKHAEINALESAREDVRGATLYVTMEPCAHQGKTPPCVDAVIRRGLGRVVIGVLDPNPLVGGKSVKMMAEHGIKVTAGVLEDACRAVNEAHFKLMTTGLPLVTVKFAQTLDGRIATAGGSSRWLSAELSLRFAHRLRAEHDAILVGAGTVIADDPQLTVRRVRGRSPLRVILDSGLRIPPEANVLAGQETARTVIATTARADPEKRDSLRARGIEVLTLPGNRDGVALDHLLPELGRRNISSLLVEGGAGVITAFLRRGLADRLVVILTPRIMGKGIEAVGELDIKEVGQTLGLAFTRVRRLGEDLVIEARLKRD